MSTYVPYVLYDIKRVREDAVLGKIDKKYNGELAYDPLTDDLFTIVVDGDNNLIEKPLTKTIKDAIRALETAGVMANASAFYYNRKLFNVFFDPAISKVWLDDELFFDASIKYYSIRGTESADYPYDLNPIHYAYFNNKWPTTDGWLKNTNTISVVDGVLRSVSTGVDSFIYKTNMSFSGNVFRHIAIKIRKIAGTVGGDLLQVYYTTAKHPHSGSYVRSVNSICKALNTWEIITLDMSTLSVGGLDYISSDITGIRFDFGTAVGQNFEIDWIYIGDGTLSNKGTLGKYTYYAGSKTKVGDALVTSNCINMSNTTLNEFYRDGTELISNSYGFGAIPIDVKYIGKTLRIECDWKTDKPIKSGDCLRAYIYKTVKATGAWLWSNSLPTTSVNYEHLSWDIIVPAGDPLIHNYYICFYHFPSDRRTRDTASRSYVKNRILSVVSTHVDDLNTEPISRPYPGTLLTPMVDNGKYVLELLDVNKRIVKTHPCSAIQTKQVSIGRSSDNSIKSFYLKANDTTRFDMSLNSYIFYKGEALIQTSDRGDLKKAYHRFFNTISLDVYLEYFDFINANTENRLRKINQEIDNGNLVIDNIAAVNTAIVNGTAIPIKAKIVYKLSNFQLISYPVGNPVSGTYLDRSKLTMFTEVNFLALPDAYDDVNYLIPVANTSGDVTAGNAKIYLSLFAFYESGRYFKLTNNTATFISSLNSYLATPNLSAAVIGNTQTVKARILAGHVTYKDYTFTLTTSPYNKVANINKEEASYLKFDAMNNSVLEYRKGTQLKTIQTLFSEYFSIDVHDAKIIPNCYKIIDPADGYEYTSYETILGSTVKYNNIFGKEPYNSQPLLMVFMFAPSFTTDEIGRKYPVDPFYTNAVPCYVAF